MGQGEKENEKNYCLFARNSPDDPVKLHYSRLGRCFFKMAEKYMQPAKSCRVSTDEGGENGTNSYMKKATSHPIYDWAEFMSDGQ